MSNQLFPYRAFLNTKDNYPKKQRGVEELTRYINFEHFRETLEKHCRSKKKSNAGRHPYDFVKMFKIIILQALYNLSDDEIEFQLNDRISFMRFCGIEAYDNIPDATTIWRFKESLGEEGSRELFEIFLFANIYTTIYYRFHRNI